MTQAPTWEMPGVGPATQAELDVIANGMFNALLTNHSGTSRPSYLTGKHGLWVDTTSAGSSPSYYILKYFDGADDIEVLRVNATSNRVEGPLSYTALPEPETVASAATANIGATKTAQVLISGTTTITSFGTVGNQLRFIRFAGALTLTHNATSLILPGARNILTSTGDVAIAISDGTGNWRVIGYDKSNGASVVRDFDLREDETSIASASTTDIGSSNTEGVLITGTTTITSFGAFTNRLRIIRFGGALTLTHNATSLVLPGGANITTSSGDIAVARSDSSGNWRVLSYQKANGAALVGGGITIGSSVTATGTSIDYVGIPASTKRFTIVFNGFSTSGTSVPIIRLGTSGGVEATGYTATGGGIFDASNPYIDTGWGVGIPLTRSGQWGGAIVVTGWITFINISGNTWISSGQLNREDAGSFQFSGGKKTLSGPLDRVRITTNGGTDTLDAGTITPMMEI